MQKLPTFDSAKYEFTYFATVTMKNAMAVQAMENRLNIIAERINELIDRDSSVDLEAFKAQFLDDLAELLEGNTEDATTDESDLEIDNLGIVGIDNLIKVCRERTLVVNSPTTDKPELENRLGVLELRYQTLAERISRIESALGHQKVEQGEKSNIFDLLV